MFISEKEREKLRNEIREQTLSSKEVLEMLGVSRERLKQIVQSGRIIPIRRGIYLKADVLAYIEKRKKML
jgi:plasmid maintenance system antidote protein VapI